MPRKRNKCCEIDCQNFTYGLRCRKHASIARKINPEWSREKYARNWTLLKKFNMNLDDFEVYWQACRGKCWICENSMRLPLTKQQGQPMDVVAVDHDHKTNKVRGLLCNACNKGLGHFHDNVELLQKAINYLKSN
jgi:hypothetical protein